MPTEQLDDREFEKLVSEKQHQELMLAIRRLIIMLENINNNTEIETAVNRLSDTLSSLLQSGVNINTGPLIKAIKEATLPKKEKGENSNDIQQCTFTVNRDGNGYIQSVTAIKF